MTENTTLKVCFFSIFILILPWVLQLSSATAYYVDVMIFVAIHSIIGCGLSLLLGYAGQISLGQAAFYGIGAYTSGILTVQAGVNPWLAMAAGIVLATATATAIGIPALRLKGHYLAMATLGFGMIIFIVFNEYIALTGGPSGFGNIPPLSVMGYPIESSVSFYYFAWLTAIIVLTASLNIVHSRPGRALRAIHDSDKASASLGINVAMAKVKVFAVSGAFGALAGSLYAHYLTFVNPPAFDVFFSLKILMIVVIGGIGSIWGAVFGAALLNFLPEWLSFLHDFDVLAYGIILLLVVMFSPQGIYGLLAGAAGYFFKFIRKEADHDRSDSPSDEPDKAV